MAFKDLNTRDRYSIIKMGVLNGLKSLDDIESFYNTYADGGNIKIVNTDLPLHINENGELYIEYNGVKTPASVHLLDVVVTPLTSIANQLSGNTPIDLSPISPLNVYKYWKEHPDEFKKTAKETGKEILSTAALLSGNPWLLATDGITSLASEEGIKKTTDLYDKEGLSFNTLKSGAGDVLNGLMVLPALGEGYNLLKNTNNRFLVGPDGKIFNSTIPYKPENYYRFVGKSAIDDANASGVIRVPEESIHKGPSFGYNYGSERMPFNKAIATLNRGEFIIEGTPESANWIDSWTYSSRRPFITARNKRLLRLPQEYWNEFYPEASTGALNETTPQAKAFWEELYTNEGLRLARLPLQSSQALEYLNAARLNKLPWLMEYDSEAFPMTNGDVNATPSVNFTYYKKYPIFGWRLKLFKSNPQELIKAAKILDSEKLSRLTDDLWDEIEKYILENYGDNSDEMIGLYGARYKLSGIPNNAITIDNNGQAKLWNHGTNYGGHSTFNSNVSNATIGGSSALGKVKGNFLAGDASNGSKPGGGIVAASNYSGTRLGADFSFPDATTPTTFLDKLKNTFGLFKSKPIHPINRLKNIVDTKRMHTYELSPVELMSDKYAVNEGGIMRNPYLERVVYPLYVNPGKTLEVDFKGKPWSEAPIEFPSKWHVNYDDAVFIPKEGTELGISPIERVYSNEGGLYNSAEEAIKSVQNKNPDLISYRRNDYYTGEPESDFKVGYDWYKLRQGEQTIPTGVRVVDNAFVNEIKYPQTTNGVVLWGASEGYDSMLMKNVIDANTGHNPNFAIDDFVPLKSLLMKLAIPTYDNNGVRIPISKRFNWSNPDVRYGLIPFALGVGASNQQALGGNLSIRH